MPQDGISADVRHFFLKVFLVLLDHPSIEVRIATLQRWSFLQLQDPNKIFVPRLLELLQSHTKTELESAADVVFKTYSRADPELMAIFSVKLLEIVARLTVSMQST